MSRVGDEDFDIIERISLKMLLMTRFVRLLLARLRRRHQLVGMLFGPRGIGSASSARKEVKVELFGHFSHL